MKYILIVCLVIAVGCKTRHENTNFEYNISENPWIDAFKDQVFFNCLRESYSDRKVFEIIEKYDAFNPYDGLDSENIILAKKLGEEISKNIPPPIMCDGCKGGQNYFMATCLHYYASKELDSIAKAEYKKFTGK